MFSKYLKTLSILKKFLFINFVIFTIIGLFTIVYLNNIQPNCKDVDFSLFGISLATLNLINSFVLTVVIVYILNYAKK